MYDKKLDKVDVTPKYRVSSTVETKGQKGQREKRERQEEDEYSESAGVKGWQKYHSKNKGRKALQLRNQDVLRVIYKKVFLQKGLVIISADLQLTNKRVLKDVELFSTKIETYWKLHKLNKGDAISIKEITSEPYFEVSVVDQDHQKKEAISNQIYSRNEEEEGITWTLWPLIDSKGRPNWVPITIYLVTVLCLVFALIMLI